jgi:hypothetical protein
MDTALHVYPDNMMTTMPGATAISFLVPLLIGVGTVTFFLSLAISMAPTEEEIHEDARIDQLSRQFGD